VTTQTDSQLLRTYAERKLEPAFTELVRRHLDFVYSAARRMVRDPHLAEDVTQGVFVALARQAPELVKRTTLAGWLHRTAQNIAAQTVRTIERRRAREQEAFAMSEPISPSPDVSWEQIEPHLDAALGELNDADRDAVFLRYFQKKTAAEIAAILGISDDAAQKRVSRAVERLREFFAKRGVSVGAGGLVVVISANAVQAAPVGLAVTISAAALAGTAATTSTLIATTTKTIAMTTLQKTLVTATVAVLAGAGIYEARQASQLRDEVQTLLQQQAPLAEQVRRLQNELGNATNYILGLTEELANTKKNKAELLKLRGEVGILNRKLQEKSPSQSKNANPNLEQVDNPPVRTKQEIQFVDAIDKAFQAQSPEQLLSMYCLDGVNDEEKERTLKMLSGFFNASFAPDGPQVSYVPVAIPPELADVWFSSSEHTGKNGITYRANLLQTGELRVAGKNQSKDGGSFTFVLGVGMKDGKLMLIGNAQTN
jgi:RNA polymerase sigma factor (sigma-70 family)